MKDQEISDLSSAVAEWMVRLRRALTNADPSEDDALAPCIMCVARARLRLQEIEEALLEKDGVIRGEYKP